MEKKVVDKKPQSLHPLYSLALKIKNGELGCQYIYCLEENKFYTYLDGYWQQIFDTEFIANIERHLPETLKLPIAAKRQVLDSFKSLGMRHLDGFNWSELINLINGMLSPYDGLLDEHGPELYSTNRIPYSYDEYAPCELWIKTLNQILENDQAKINILQEFFGYCLTRETKHHKALLLLGESRSGKSTILQILRNVVGTKNCSSVPLKCINDDQYTPMLINKLVNIDTDVSAKAVEFESEFKTITAGEPIHSNQKYAPAFDFNPFCKLVMAANIFPKITDHSSAFYNRLILIPCDRVFTPDEQNKDLPKLLLKELPGILNWSIAGLKKLTTRGKFEELNFMHDAIEELENDNNPVNMFIDEYTKISMGENQYIEKGELYEKYKSWSDTTKNYPLSLARFSSCIFRRYHKVTPKTTQHPDTKKRIWRNIIYVDVNNKHGDLLSWQE
jgi:P4 family phage/plasmid primase-like protien